MAKKTDKNAKPQDEKKRDGARPAGGKKSEKRESAAKNTKKAYASLTGFRRAVPIILAAIAVFIAVCFIAPEGTGVGKYIGDFLLGILSVGGYLVPAFLILHAIFYPRDVAKKCVLGRIVFTLIALLAFSALLHTVNNFGVENPVFDTEAFYNDGKECIGGGWLGGVIGYGLMSFIGRIGMIILAVAIFALYLTYFFANGKSTLAKILLNILNKISDSHDAKKKKKEEAREAKRIKTADRKHPRISPKHEGLYEDEFFAVDNGMSEIRIDELGIRETRRQADLEKMPHLEDKVRHDNQDTTDDDNIFVDTAPEEEEILEDIIIEEAHDEPVYDEPAVHENERADEIFAKDFDPFDFDKNAEISAKQRQRTRDAAVVINEYAEPVSRFSEKEINEARERDEFERRKRAVMEAEERRRALEEEERKHQMLREILREEKPEPKATYTSYKDAAPRYEPATAAEYESREPARQEAAPAPRAEIYETAKTYEPAAKAEFYEPVKTYEPVAKAEPYEPVKTYEPAAKAEPYEPVKTCEPVAKAEPYEPASTVKEFKEYTFPEEPSRTELDEQTHEDTLKLSRESIISSAYIEDDVDDDEDEAVEEFTIGPPDDEDFEDEPIPPEKQNPIINEYRSMFSVFGEEKEEKREALVVTNQEPLIAEAEEPAIAAEPAEELPKAPTEKPIAKETKKSDEPDYSNYKLPPLDLLKKGNGEIDPHINEEIERNGEKLIDTLAQFNVKASIRSVDVGPRITRYEIVPAKGVRVNSVINLFDDIALNLAAEGIRMEAPIPGRSAIGVEIPNKNSQMVYLRELLETDEFKNATSTTMACFGKDVTGNPVLGDIAKMPHMLIAGATGMGKSVCINSIILSMLFRSRPDELKFIMIDPKMVEFNSYNGIPHLLIPVIIDVKQAAGALMWAVEQMEKRYELFLEYSVKNLDGYNEKLRERGEKALPKIIIIIDELADLMLQARKPVEDLIMRIAQKARAAGIHLIIGTQRPSVDIITGVIKANIPSRLSCKVSSFQDSKTILEQAGAEKLLSHGDMLFWPVGKPKPTRVQGSFVSDSEVDNIMSFLKKQNKGNVYDEQALAEINSAAQKCSKGGKNTDDFDDADDGDEGGGYFNDPQFLHALQVAVSQGKIATSLIQRKLGIGYSKAAKFIDIMQEQGFVSEPNGQKAREVLITKDELDEVLARRGVN